MKTRGIFLFIILALCSNFSFAKSYQSEINNLQKQIDELNKKLIQESQSTNNLKSIKSILDGLTINGRLHVDGKWYSEDNSLKGLDTYNDKFSIRRARLSINKQKDNFIFNFEGNYNNDEAKLGLTYISYKPNKNSEIYFGQFTPTGFIEREKSSNSMGLVEYNSIQKVNWINWYLIGLNYSYKNDKIGFSTGIFGNGTDDEDSLESNMAYNFSSRLFYTPIRSEDYVIHIGLDSIYQDYKNDIINNSDYINNTYIYGLEFAVGYKNISLTNEYAKAYYNYEKNNFNGNKFNFDAFSTEFVINFTGENQKYTNSGCFGNIDIINPLSKGGVGAFQGVLRYSFADGKDTSNGYLNNIGSHYDYSIGLSWIPENYFRLLVNYSKNKIVTKNYEERGKYDAFNIEARMFF